MSNGSMGGLMTLVSLLESGPQTVRALIQQGDVDRALGQALWLKSAGHPQGNELVAEARRALDARRAVFVLPL